MLKSISVSWEQSRDTKNFAQNEIYLQAMSFSIKQKVAYYTASVNRSKHLIVTFSSVNKF